MFRILGVHLLKSNQFSRESCGVVHKLSTSACTRYKSTPEEIAELKQRDQETRWAKLYHFTNMKYHSIVTRLKIYPMIMGVIGTPIAYLVEVCQIFPEFTYVPFLAMSEYGCTFHDYLTEFT